MQAKNTLTTLSATAVAVVAFSLVGCSSNPPATDVTPTRPTVVATSTASLAEFNQPTLSEKVTDLTGTALVSVSPDLDKNMKKPAPETSGAYFLLISPSNPTLGVLVWAGADSTPASVAARKSEKVKVSGPVKTFEDPGLAQWVKEHHGISLCTQGTKLQYIVPEGQVWPAVGVPASATPMGGAPPVSPATPGASATPRLSPTPMGSSTPGAMAPSPTPATMMASPTPGTP